jgi:hypothetical protein
LIEYAKLDAVSAPVQTIVKLFGVTDATVTIGGVGGGGSVVIVKGGDGSGGVGLFVVTTMTYVVLGLAPEKAAVLPTVTTFME